ncbi:acyltransferase family protein [Streptomyces sp. NPDC051909]|uniref:acyltransferase family protein n=1 Tax=Streptomyces sp. NPDC051909 TaxID=3154944 RepID=UPI00343A733E
MSQNAPSALSSGASDSSPAGRTAYFDNAKLLAVVLVVCGHFWEPLIGQPEQRHIKALYLLVYTFHMPAFILVSGFFSRGFTAQPRQIRRLVSGVLVPFVLWGTLLALFNGFVTDESVTIKPLTPVWVTWFLIALFLWRLSTPLWRNLRAPVTTATALFLAAGAFSLGAQLSITRVLQFLPCFVIGLVMDPRHLARLREARWIKAAAVISFLTVGGAAFVVAPDFNAVWLYRSAGAPDLHVSYGHWVAEALVIHVVGLVLTAAFLVLVPSRRTWYTSLGAGTMCAFLLHAFIRQAMVATGLYERDALQGLPGQLALTALALALALLLCTRPVRALMRPLVEPRLNWLFRPDAPARSESARVHGPS